VLRALLARLMFGLDLANVSSLCCSASISAWMMLFVRVMRMVYCMLAAQRHAPSTGAQAGNICKKSTRSVRLLLLLLLCSSLMDPQSAPGHGTVVNNGLYLFREAYTPTPHDSPEFPNATLPSAWKRFNYHTYSSMVITLARLAYSYPAFARLYTTQAAFGLPAAGESCSIDTHQPMSQEALTGLDQKQRLAVKRLIEELRTQDGLSRNACRVWVLEIADRSSVAQGSVGSVLDPPAILISGALHGDERIGPTAVTELARVLLEASRLPAGSVDTHRWRASAAEEADGSIFGSTAGSLSSWLRFLVGHRRITIVPAANAIGFALGERTELGVDPNRDFPWNQPYGASCLESVAARSIHELVLANTYQMMLTFHGGTTVIGYEWGDLTHCPEQQYCRRNSPAPDIIAMQTIAYALRLHAGNGTRYGARPFDIGTMGDTVYPVAGGMEDWAYGASAPVQTSLVSICNASRYGGYAPVKVQAVRQLPVARMIALLIETADDKQPSVETLGARPLGAAGNAPWQADVRLITETPTVSADGSESDSELVVEGHVWRNLRLALQAIDILQPYAAFTRYPGDGRTQAADNATAASIVCWRVGGAYHVAETQLQGWYDSGAAARIRQNQDSAPDFVSEAFIDASPDPVPFFPAVRLGQGTRWSPDSHGGREFCVNLQQQQQQQQQPFTGAKRPPRGSSILLRVRFQADVDWGRLPPSTLGAQPPNTRPWSFLAQSRVEYNSNSTKFADERPSTSEEDGVARGTNWFSRGLHCRASEVSTGHQPQVWTCVHSEIARGTELGESGAMSGWSKLLLAISVFLLAPGSFPLLLFLSFLLWRLVRGQSVHPAEVWFEARQRMEMWMQGLRALGRARGPSGTRVSGSFARSTDLDDTKRRMLSPTASSAAAAERDASSSAHDLDLEASTRRPDRP